MSQDPTIRMLCRKTGLALNADAGPHFFVAPPRDATGRLQYAKLRVLFERNEVHFLLDEDIGLRPAVRAAVARFSTNATPVQNQIEMIMGYGPAKGFRRARLMRNGGVDILSNGLPCSTDPMARRAQGLPLRTTDVCRRIKELGFRPVGKLDAA